MINVKKSRLSFSLQFIFMLSFRKRGKAYLRQSSGMPGAPSSAWASACWSRCSELTVCSQEAGEPESVRPRSSPVLIRAHTCFPRPAAPKQQPRTGPVLAEGDTLFSEPQLSQLGSCWDNCGEGLYSRDKTLSCCCPRADTQHYHPAFPVLQSANCNSSQQLVAGAACRHTWLQWLCTSMPIVALFSQNIFLKNASSTVKLDATLLRISKMAGPLSTAATAHWVPLAFRSHSNSQQTDLASMADHVQRTTQLVNFFLSNSSFFEWVGGGSFCYLSKCFPESASAWFPPPPPPALHTHRFSGELLLYMSVLHREIEEAKL